MFNVRLHGHRGLSQIPQINPTQYTADAVFQVNQPYEWAQTISVSAVAASSLPIADANAQSPVNLVRVEVPSGQQIRYEINPPGRAVVAGTDSPILAGINFFYFRSGWTMSLIDAAGLA